MSELRDDGLSRLYRAVASDEPPAGVDAAILAAARQALAAAPARRRPAWLSWLAPAGLAATMVLTLSVVMLTRQEQPDLLPAPAQAPTRPAAAPLPAASADIPARQEAAMPAAAAPPEAPAAKSVARKALPERAAAAPVSQPQPPAAPAVPAMSEPFPAATTAGAVMKAPAAAPAAEAAAAPQSLAIPAAPAPVMESAGARDRALAAPRPAPADARALPSAAKSRVDPEAWLETIRRLRRQGEVDAAREQLAAFRRSFPDWPLPDDLRD